jgi:hypothetical protein
MLAIRCEIFGSLGSFHHGLVGVALEHQGGDAPNVDLRYQNARLMKSAPGLSMTLGNAAAARVRFIVWCKPAFPGWYRILRCNGHDYRISYNMLCEIERDGDGGPGG